MKKEIKMLFINTRATKISDNTRNGVFVKEITPDLKNYYVLLDCSTIDIVERKIGNNWYDIILDDEGLFKEDLMPTCFCEKYKNTDYGFMYGSVLICKCNEEGNEESLTDAEIEEIKNNISIITYDNKEYNVVNFKYQ